MRGRVGRYVVLAVTILAVVGIFALNILLNYVGGSNLLYLDLTPEEFYTVSDTMKEHTAAFVNKLESPDKKIKITFCTDPDILTGSQNLRMPYFLALGLAKLHPERIEVETVNVEYNPTAVSKYKANSLTQILPTDIIFSYGERYRIVGADSMWVADSSTGQMYSFNGEYKMATIMMSVTAKERPVAYFSIGHGETYYDTANPTRAENAEAQAIFDLLSERGLKVKTVDLRYESVPEDCVLLVINDPWEDYTDGAEVDKNAFGYISQTEKIDRYLVLDQGAVMISKDPTLDLHNFDLFLYEWGFEIPNAVVEDNEYYIERGDGSRDKIIGIYDTDTSSYGSAIYGSYAALPSAPSMVFSSTGFIKSSFGLGGSISEPGTVTVNRHYAPFFYSSGEAVAKGEGNVVIHDASTQGRMDIAAVTTRMAINQTSAEYDYSYVFCSPSRDAFSNEILGNGSYANFEVMSSLVENISRIDAYASLELGGTSFNSSNFGGKPFLDVSMSEDPVFDINDDGQSEMVIAGLSQSKRTTYTVMIMIVPLALAVLGIVVKLKRRYR